MKFLDLTFATPEENLACDEALLDLVDAGSQDEILRLWEPLQHFIVLGISGRVRDEVHPALCRKLRIPILRRVSGGGTVLQGPGCLNFSLVLKIKPGPLESLRETTEWIMEKHRDLLEKIIGRSVKVQGTSDLTVGSLKFSGNAQRRKRTSVLFHGTFLHGLDLGLVEKLLPLPDRRPVYRENRTHQSFIVNLTTGPEPIRTALRGVWKARTCLTAAPAKEMTELIRERYSKQSWNWKF